MRICWIGLLLFGVALSSGSGCQNNDPSGIVAPPLMVRSTFPGDETPLNLAGEDSVILDLSVVFVRAAQRAEARFQIFPEPASAGPITLSSTGRTWTWNDVVFRKTPAAYFWVIDGSDVPIPKVVRLITGFVRSSVGFKGTLSSSDPESMPIDGCIVFALPFSGSFDPQNAASFFDSVPLAVARVDSAGNPGQRDYLMSYMVIDVSVNVVAILDTNNDAIYDPTVDAWGYKSELGSRAPENIITRPPPLFAATGYRSDVDFMVLPAGSPR